MSFPSDINITGTTVERTYSMISTVGTKSIRRNSAIPLSTPDLLTISHQEIKRNSGVVDRHLIRFDETKEDATDNSQATLIGYIVLEVPRDIFVSADVTDMLDRMKNFTSASNMVKVLNSEP